MLGAAGNTMRFAIARDMNLNRQPRVTCSEHVEHGSRPMQMISSLFETQADPFSLSWQPGMPSNAASEIADTIERIRDQERHKDFRKRTESAVLEAIKSPAVAACILFHRLADENPRERVHARDLIRARLDSIVPKDQRDDVMTLSAWVVDRLVDPSEPMHHFAELWLRRLTPDERAHLIEVASEVTEANGPPSEQQRKGLKLLRRALCS